MDDSKRKQTEKKRIPPFSKTVYDQVSDQLLRDVCPELDDYHFIIWAGYRATIKGKI